MPRRRGSKLSSGRDGRHRRRGREKSRKRPGGRRQVGRIYRRARAAMRRVHAAATRSRSHLASGIGCRPIEVEQLEDTSRFLIERCEIRLWTVIRRLQQPRKGVPSADLCIIVVVVLTCGQVGPHRCREDFARSPPRRTSRVPVGPESGRLAVRSNRSCRFPLADGFHLELERLDRPDVARGCVVFVGDPGRVIFDEFLQTRRKVGLFAQVGLEAPFEGSTCFAPQAGVVFPFDAVRSGR